MSPSSIRLAITASVLFLACSSGNFGTAPFPLVDDHVVTVDGSNVEAKRAALVSYLWGERGFPTALPTVRRGVPSPIPGLGNVRRVDELHVAMDGGEENVTLHFVAEPSNGRLVVVALGHMCTFADGSLEDEASDEGYGLSRTIGSLLKDGYSVLGAYMPHRSPGQCEDVEHDALLAQPVGYGHAAKWFVEPIAVSLNYVSTQGVPDDFPHYRDFSMTGLSGGGWTTTLYAAIDPRITTSIPIAGSVPLYLRSAESLGDDEQLLPDLYSIAGYLDLYALGAAGAGRHQTQVLNRNDNCCFGERAYMYDAARHGAWDEAMRTAERAVDGRLAAMGSAGGTFRLEIDETADHHTISWSTLVGTVLGELNGGTRRVTADSPERVYLRERGTIWTWGEGRFDDLGLPVAGTPSAVRGPRGTELFYRSPANRLIHAYPAAGGWIEEPLGAVLISDPVAVRSPIDGHFAVAGVDPSYRPIVVSVSFAGDRTAPTIVTLDPGTAAATPRVVGTPALAWEGSTLQIYARGIDRALHLFEAPTNGGPLVHATLGGALLDFPAAVTASDGSAHAFVNDATTGHLREVTRGLNRAWVWRDVVSSATPNGPKHSPLRGTPTITMGGPDLRVQSRTLLGSLEVLKYDSGAGDWSSSWVHLRMNGSPLAVGDEVFGTVADRHLWRYDGSTVLDLGRPQ